MTRTATAREGGYASALARLTSAQKPAARSAPAYSRFINRRLGRYLAAGAYTVGLTPNAVTGISALFTFTSLALLIAFPPSLWLGVAVAGGLLIGYAFDSADGQLARLTGASSPAGEWLDHFVDSIKASALPLALLIGFYRFESVPVPWLLVPLVGTVVSAVLFFAMILTEQLRRAHSSQPLAAAGSSNSGMPGAGGWVRSVLVAPMDYGVLCLSFVLLGWLPAFLVVYTVIIAATTLFLALAAVKWFRELSRTERAS